ncbi:MAG TPA: transglutaminase-like domain-containing protein, partial [Flexilinea sp.]|nr:transglutaminase-like domain-containing protein [Flexilinea sp.]
FKIIPEVEKTFSPFHISEIAGEGDTFTKAIHVMQWICGNTAYDGASPLGPSLPDKLIEYSFGKQQEHPINCTNRAVLLCDALMTLGICAIPVFLLNYGTDPKYEDYLSAHCHVVVHLYFSERNCWVALDPSFNNYFVNTYNELLNLIDIRDSIRKNKEVFAIDNATKEINANGLKCLTLGLLDLSMFPGNDFGFRYNWSLQYHLLPAKYIKELEYIAKNDKNANQFYVNIAQCRKLTILEFLSPPLFVK